jgi:3-hydroxyisobutyrate dehydrogenase-like beta-hydroxyacid dehydrogenase
MGNMGSALARALLAGGHQVTVWNRTAERCRPLVDLGAHRAESAAEAVDSAETVVVCVLDYGAAKEILAAEGVATGARDSVIVNYSTGSPDEARDCDAWASANAARYIEGAIFAYPRAVGTPECTLAHSGPTETFEAVRPILESMGTARQMGEDVALANILNFAAGIFYEVALGAFVEAAAYAAAEGATPADVTSLLKEALLVVSDSVEYSTPQLMREDYSGEEASIDVHADAVEAIAKKMTEVGSANKLATALLEYLHEAQQSGDGSLEFAAIYDIARRA